MPARRVVSPAQPPAHGGAQVFGIRPGLLDIAVDDDEELDSGFLEFEDIAILPTGKNLGVAKRPQQPRG